MQKGERKESLTNDEEERMKRKRGADYQRGNEFEFDPDTKRQKGERRSSLTNDKEEERMKRKRRADDDQHGNETESDPEIEDEVR